MAKHKGSRRANGTGGIFRDGDGWRVRVAVGVDPVTGKTKFRKVRAKTQAEAVEALRHLEAARNAGKLAPAKGATVESFLTFWLENIRANRAPNTHRQYAWIVADHVLPHLGTKRVDQVTRPMIQALLKNKATQKVKSRAKNASSGPEKTLSRATLRLIRVILHAAFQAAIHDGITTMNPVEHVEVPAEPKKPPIFLDPLQAAALFQAASESELSELFRFMLLTGARIGEATGVRWQDLDLQKGFVRIRGQLQRIDGKLTYRAVTKTNQDRAISISPSLVEAFTKLKIVQEVNGMADPEGIVFLNAEGRRLDPKFVSKKLACLCIAAKVPVVSPHKLRHTAATVALAETGDLHGVQKMLGHQQVSLTADLYGHATAETLRPVTNAIEKAIRTL